LFVLCFIGKRGAYHKIQLGGVMTLSAILAEIDEEISKLKQARTLLADESVAKRGPGRPKGSLGKSAKKKRNLTPEGRKRIAEAVRRRWAAQKKASS
jgi:hypothetical protein